MMRKYDAVRGKSLRLMMEQTSFQPSKSGQCSHMVPFHRGNRERSASLDLATSLAPAPNAGFVRLRPHRGQGLCYVYTSQGKQAIFILDAVANALLQTGWGTRQSADKEDKVLKDGGSAEPLAVPVGSS